MADDPARYAIGFVRMALLMADATSALVAKKGFGTVVEAGSPHFGDRFKQYGLQQEDWPGVRALTEGLMSQPELRTRMRKILG